MAVIETNGLSDRGLYSQVMANLGKAYSQYGVGDGNYPNVDDILTDRALYNVWMRNLLNAKIFIDGMGVTNRTAQAQGVSSVRVPIMAPPPYVPRTITMQPYTGSYLPGTPGNDGLENRNLPNTPQTDGFDVYFNQLYDQPTVIYKLSQNMLSLPIVAQYTGMIPDTVANMEDSTIMATQIKGALYRAATTENANVVDVDLTSTDDGYLQQTMNKVIGLMTNPQTSWAEGIVQYDLDRCVIIMKQAFFDLLFSVKNGVLINGGNLPQEMLLRGAFTEDGRPKGNLIRGMYSGVYIKVVPILIGDRQPRIWGSPQISSLNLTRSRHTSQMRKELRSAVPTRRSTRSPIPVPALGPRFRICGSGAAASSVLLLSVS